MKQHIDAIRKLLKHPVPVYLWPEGRLRTLQYGLTQLLEASEQCTVGMVKWDHKEEVCGVKNVSALAIMDPSKQYADKKGYLFFSPANEVKTESVD